ncbi:piggyBac transposable element-derived protein 4-like [Arapaima gigas]
MAARKRRELFTILETDTERDTLSDSRGSDVKWLEIPFRKRDSDEEDEDDDDDEEDDDEEDGFGGAEALGAADAGGYLAGGGCNIILVTDNGAKQDEDAEDAFYSGANNSFSESASNDSDIDFSDLEATEQEGEEEEEEEGEDGQGAELRGPHEDCATPLFWGEPDQLVSIEPFSAPTGPRHVLGDEADARDYFRLLFPDALFEHMVEQTNNYALYRQRRSGRIDPHWHPTNVREMQAYIGLNILMGINQLPDYGMYWATDIFIGNAGFKKTMTARRFEKLNQNIHLFGIQRSYIQVHAHR